MDSHSADFHESEIDIYDLYNACNGALREDGLLDISQLKAYGPDDYELLNVPRLQEIWDHTVTGCPTCKDIILALNRMRGVIKAEVSLI